MNKTERIKELVKILNEASEAYYSEDTEIISNLEYDALYDELVSLEAETGIVLSSSPTVNVGYGASESLEKERHESPMLSLDKTKDVGVLAAFAGNRRALLSWKLDGLTVVLTYENGTLLKAVTRGNGEIGEVVTDNARVFKNLPLTIPFKGRLVLRGEAVIKYSDFERINARAEDSQAKYKNPRNLCSGAVRQLDSSVTAKRSVNFIAFSLESAVLLSGGAGGSFSESTAHAPGSKNAASPPENLQAAEEFQNARAAFEGGAGEGDVSGVPGSFEPDFENSNEKKFIWLKEQGFDVVPYRIVNESTMAQAVADFEKEIQDFDFPSDGLVLLLDDIEYGKSLGFTAKFPRNSIAFKWKDETALTKLLEVEWSPSRTGLINPVAVFESVELEGTSVSRASVHNVSTLKSLKLGIGDTLSVYKANMIIPQIAENLTKSDTLKIPSSCPACGGITLLKDENGVQTLICPNPGCPAKKIKNFANFVSRNAMNVDGISIETLEKFIGCGFISGFADIYHLDEHKDEIIAMPGFGEKSYANIIESVDRSRKTTPQRLLNALGIAGVGSANAKLICSRYGGDFSKIIAAKEEELTEIDGIGPVLASAICGYFKNEKNYEELQSLLKELRFESTQPQPEQPLKGITFVITGTLENYANREALKAEIESKGGKVSGSVSSKTGYLINNDAASASSKNRKARELGIPVITESEYIEMFK